MEQEEREITDEAILLMIAILGTSRDNIKRELRSFYQQYGRDGVVTWKEARKWIGSSDHRRRLTALLQVISNEFDQIYGNLTPQFVEYLTKVIEKETDFFDAEVEIEKALYEDWGSDEQNWEERLAADVSLWFFYIQSDLKRFILRQTKIDEILSQMDKRFTTMEKVLDTLALSESTAVGSIARREIFKELGITKYQFFTKVDERRCEVCGAMHGLIFPISAYEVGVTASPIHPRCRCWEVPIVD